MKISPLGNYLVSLINNKLIIRILKYQMEDIRFKGINNSQVDRLYKFQPKYLDLDYNN
jgi:hypothetical protein